MIIKIVHHETVGEEGLWVAPRHIAQVEAAPKRVILLDAVDEVEHEKVACHNEAELVKLVDQFGHGLDGARYGPALPRSNEHEDQAGGIEAILMQVRRDGTIECIVAVDSAVYFMNESGKTIDKVVCR